MSLRRLLPLVAALALLFAPFGRIGTAEALAMPHHPPMAAAGHCNDGSSPEDGAGDRVPIDCLTACAAMTAAECPLLEPDESAPVALSGRPLTNLRGLHPQSDPPPPRLS